MLGAHPIHPVLLSTDLAAARDFYHTKVGLEILNESEAAIVFRCGGGTQLSVTKSTTGTLVWNDRQLFWVLTEYLRHYNGARPHRSLDLQPPRSTRPTLVETGGRESSVQRMDVLGGLIHEYRRAA